MNTLCPICHTNPVHRESSGKDLYDYECPRCGDFSITGSADAVAKRALLEQRTRANASAWVRANQLCRITDADLNSLWTVRVPTVHERAMLLLQELARRYPGVADEFDFNFSEAQDPALVATAWCLDDRELGYLAINYLWKTLNAIDGLDGETRGTHTPSLVAAKIAPKGHELLEKLRDTNAGSAIGFCAMSFLEELTPLWKQGIAVGIREAGYDAVRLDEHEFADKIDDAIIAMIRRSRFVVADLTRQRPNVYFEAGFALGLGLRVIWTCRKDEIYSNEVHFDTRQYNFIDWEPNDYPGFVRRLKARIEAILGPGRRGRT
jgi:nucleoside 2-deoxyribosyltransferase